MAENFHWTKREATYENNLDEVTVATPGIAVDVRKFQNKTVFVDVPVNTGAVTVNIEGSFDKVKWFNLISKTYEIVDSDVFPIQSHMPYMRTTTTAQTDATVSTDITGGV